MHSKYSKSAHWKQKFSKSRMEFLKHFEEVLKVDAKFTMLIIASLLLLYIAIKIILKIADFFALPIFLIFAAVFVFVPEVNKLVKEFATVNAEPVLKYFGIK